MKTCATVVASLLGVGSVAATLEGLALLPLPAEAGSDLNAIVTDP